ncbi:MAG: phosphinothricin acetyltransferase [Capnocytophaga ochracea]
MWRVIYSVSPRTPEGGQAGKGDKPPPSAHTQLRALVGYLQGGRSTTGKVNLSDK